MSDQSQGMENNMKRLAERLGLPVDAGRVGAYGPNVTVLRDFVRSSRQPL